MTHINITSSFDFFYPPGCLEILYEVLQGLKYDDNWSFQFKQSGGSITCLHIRVTTKNSLNLEQPWIADHYFTIPSIPWDKKYCERWVLDQIVNVHIHEACEHFEVYGKRPFYPSHSGEKHGDGNSYIIKRRKDDYDPRKNPV